MIFKFTHPIQSSLYLSRPSCQQIIFTWVSYRCLKLPRAFPLWFGHNLSSNLHHLDSAPPFLPTQCHESSSSSPQPYFSSPNKLQAFPISFNPLLPSLASSLSHSFSSSGLWSYIFSQKKISLTSWRNKLPCLMLLQHFPISTLHPYPISSTVFFTKL